MIKQMTADFKKEIHDKSKEIDPSNEQDWFSLTLGWAIAKGMNINQAYKFARHIRYNTNLG